MATYLVTPDDYAGWNPTGRNFTLVGLAAAAAGLLAWLALHNRLGSLHPTAASDQLFVSSIVWLGGGLFCLMIFAGLGSLSLSSKAQGTVGVTPQGVSRTIRARTHFVAWSAIQGLVPMPQGGVTLVTAAQETDIVIPRFLDDYRACIAEIKTYGIQAIPPSSLRHKQKNTWQSLLLSFFMIFYFVLCTDPHESHSTRIASLSFATALLAQTLYHDQARLQTTSRGLSLVVFLGILAFILWRMAVTW